MSITQVHVSSPHTLMVQDHDEDDRQYINEIRIEMLGVSPTSKRVWPTVNVQDYGISSFSLNKHLNLIQ